MKKHKPILSGDVFQLNYGGSCTVIEYKSSSSVLISHNDDFGHVMEVDSRNLRLGQISNPYHRSVFGVGFIGHGAHKTKDGKKHTQAYIAWSRMMARAYSEAYHASRPTYSECSVCPEWHNFQTFADWHSAQDHSCSPGFELDKDLTVIGNKSYRPEACSFVPSQINSLTIDSGAARGSLPIGVHLDKERGRYGAKITQDGCRIHLGWHKTPHEAFLAYKAAKRIRINQVAEKYKDYITDTIYKNLIDWDIVPFP